MNWLCNYAISSTVLFGILDPFNHMEAADRAVVFQTICTLINSR